MKYPIGIQDFKKIRRENYVYIDKTRLIYKMVSE
ncbi:MAG: AAA family ATPase [Prevotella sp.]|nr:AAA family ATPase [Prevotella sp.]MBR1526904.1 AAA family ATPase [Prevotella sp.]